MENLPPIAFKTTAAELRGLGAHSNAASVQIWVDNEDGERVRARVERRPAVIQLYRNWIRTTYSRHWDVAQNLGRPAPALDNPADQARRRLSLENYN